MSLKYNLVINKMKKKICKMSNYELLRAYRVASDNCNNGHEGSCIVRDLFLEEMNKRGMDRDVRT